MKLQPLSVQSSQACFAGSPDGPGLRQPHPVRLRGQTSAWHEQLSGRWKGKRLADLERENASLRDFIATLAHELRSPLAPITYALRLLQKRAASHEAQEQYAVIERQTLRLRRLVDDAFDAERLSRGQMEIVRKPVDLGAIAQHVAEASRARVEAGGHQLTYARPQDPLWAHGDLFRLEQMLANLVENAAKYTPPGGRIVITLERAGAESRLSVEDDGIGIAAENLERIFSLFEQIGVSSTSSVTGLGIGLNLVRRIAQLHGGGVEAQSAGLGLGATFVVRLPSADISVPT